MAPNEINIEHHGGPGNEAWVERSSTFGNGVPETGDNC